MEPTILCRDLLSQNGKHEGSPCVCLQPLVSSRRLPALCTSIFTSLHPRHLCAVCLFPPSIHSTPSLSLTPVHLPVFSTPERRRCIHGNKAKVEDGGEG